MDTKVLLSHSGKWCASNKRSASILALFCIFIGLLLSSGCAGTTEAASDPRRSAGLNAPAWSGDAMVAASQPLAQESTVLHFAPSSAQVTVGGVVAVQLRLENVDNLYGVEVHLTFDKNVIQIEDDDGTRDGVQITPGELPYPDFSVQNMVDNLGGRLDYAVVQLSPRPPAQGSGVVATIHFRGVREGSSPIRFSGAKLASPEGMQIAATLQEGSIVVGVQVGPTPTVIETPTPTPEPSGPTVTSSLPTSTALPDAASTATPTATACPTLYVVRSGDTTFSISRRFGVSLDALATANTLSSSYDIKIGQLLIIPTVPGPTGTNHVVLANETLYSIARRYGTSVETLAAINRLPYPWRVQLGQTLLLCPAQP